MRQVCVLVNCERKVKDSQNANLAVLQLVRSNCWTRTEMPFDSMSGGKRGVLRRSTCPAEQGRGREGGIKGQRDCFLWCVFPQGQRGGLEQLPWQIWRCPVLLFLCSPSSCRKQHHAGHQILGKLWRFTVLMQECVNTSPHRCAKCQIQSDQNSTNTAQINERNVSSFDV